MKKLMSLLLVPILSSIFLSQSVSCSVIGNLNKYNYLGSLKNFDWSDKDYGDGIEYNTYSDDYKLNNDEIKSSDIGSVTANNSNNYLDFENFNTGFQWKQNIQKQAVTGVPLNKGFMPNGNFASDFGVTSPAQSYRRLNSILNWNPDVDNDAKFNKSEKSLKKSDFTGAKNVKSQDERLNYNYLGFSSRKHRTYDNTVVGTKNPYENTNLNWQYNNEFINWSGSWFEGPIIPPPSDVIELAHNNGSKIFGNIFLDGYHGLTKEMLSDFLKKDSNGEFLIVNKLIEIANYVGFDGWFINNEANGVNPNGSVLDFNDMTTIIKSFNEKTLKSNNEQIKNLRLIYYRNDANLGYSGTQYYDNETTSVASQSVYKYGNLTKTTEIQVNFGEIPDNSEHFLNEFKDFNGSDIYGLIDGSSNYFINGVYDYKDMAYKKNYNSTSNEDKYNKNVYSSIGTYFDAGTDQSADAAFKLVTRKLSKPREFIFKSQVQHLFNDIVYSGTNLFLSDNDNGLSASNLSKITKNIDYKTEIVKADPRIHFDKEYTPDNTIINELYNYNSGDNPTGYNNFSYGIGDLIHEKTTLIDENIDNSILKTNFSTGSGIKFVDNNQIDNYPWTNRRLGDVLPTYKWRIFDSTEISKPLNISEFSGGYDYDEPYKKGNSIVIGSGFDESGKIVDSKSWDINKTYGWDIMGSKIMNNKKTISFVYKDNANKSPDVSLRLSFADSKGNLLKDQIKSIDVSNVVDMNNGWKEISYDLSGETLNSNRVLSMIGLNIKPNSDTFKFNVGEMVIKDNNYQDNFKKAIISNPNVEYLVYREFEKNILNNIRISFESSNIDSVDYFEFYVYDGKNWYRDGETTQLNYYLKDLKSFNNTLSVSIKPVYKNRNIEGNAYKFDINL
ncbi:endo-beta-N-acetylglucosaminidase [Spiroplasma corruscae]|uniref:Endo-beta-N-acetylglucosaminidase n=1 Tax=Spiroplasma corruscae TaxID=216934 RepID=A0A222ENT1_9MOLU|nr:hypothetical protein [Spiroplasma corruscae]ASP28147.1 endo-beta-N-acetylglucosaminidase [Spiroplasma corruscae]